MFPPRVRVEEPTLVRPVLPASTELMVVGVLLVIVLPLRVIVPPETVYAVPLVPRPCAPSPKVRLPTVIVPAVIVWLVALPPKMAESPDVHDASGAEVVPLSQFPPESQFCAVVVVLSLALLALPADPSHHLVAAGDDWVPAASTKLALRHMEKLATDGNEGHFLLFFIA